eukprot:XP_017952751.1 PREDICTED: uromodulin-like [Xenopus tropicalis]
MPSTQDFGGYLGTFGQVKVTYSKDEFKSFFNSLNAYDGGDCPELAMNGLKVALENSPDRSFILVLTDASAKDYDDIPLLNSIRSLINTTQSQVVFLITGLCSSSNDPDFLIYRDIASMSSGHVFQIGLSDMPKVFNYLDFTLSRPANSREKLFYKYYNASHSDNFSVSANYTTLLVITDGAITSIGIVGPGSKDLNIKTIVFEIWGSIFQIKNPAIGEWTIFVDSNGPHAIRVEAYTVFQTSLIGNCSDCHPNATCEVYLGRLQCTCKDGFIGDGFSCSDVDECAYSWLNNCTYGYCVNTIGSYDCLCPVGYTKGTGRTCVDINECSSPDLNKCHPLAVCVNYEGTYKCQCPPGVIGNGFYCEIDQCARNVCGSSMECSMTGSSYSCSNPCVNHTVLDEPWRSTANAQYVNILCDYDKMGWYRFVGSGGIRMPESCVPELRCSTHAPMWLNGSHPAPTNGIVTRTACAHWAGDCCQWSSTIQIKACPGGYHVYKLNTSPACSLAYCTDPSSLNDECLCTDDEECRFVSGSYGCYCKENRTISALTDLTPTVSCGLQSMKTTFRQCQLRALNIDVKDIILADSYCFNVLNDNTTNTYSVLSSLQAGNCGMTLSTNGTHAFYRKSFDFTFLLNGLIIRDRLTTTSTCIYPLDMRISLNTALNPIISTTIIETNGTGNFIARMAVYNSSDYKYPYQGAQINLYTKTVIYIGVFLEGPDPSLYAMVLNNCYATPSSIPDDPIKYYVIQNRCPSKSDGTVSVLENGVSSQAQFSFQMFAFAGNYNQVYLHCQIYACDSRTSTCASTCSGSRALDVATQTTTNLKIGPFNRLGR